MLQHLLIQHMQNNSRGIVNLSFQQATEIIHMVTNYRPDRKAHALLYRYAQGGNMELVRTIATSNEKIKELIQTALVEGPTYNFYKYDLYNDDHEFEGNLYTCNPNLFD